MSYLNSEEEQNATYAFLQVGLFNANELRLLVPLQLVQPNFILHQLAKQEGKQFLVIARLG